MCKAKESVIKGLVGGEPLRRRLGFQQRHDLVPYSFCSGISFIYLNFHLLRIRSRQCSRYGYWCRSLGHRLNAEFSRRRVCHNVARDLPTTKVSLMYPPKYNTLEDKVRSSRWCMNVKWRAAETTCKSSYAVLWNTMWKRNVLTPAMFRRMSSISSSLNPKSRMFFWCSRVSCKALCCSLLDCVYTNVE